MVVALDSVLFRSPDPKRAAAFWGAILERSPVDQGGEWRAELDAELDRLSTLGATHAVTSSSGVLLRDPDGVEFELRVS